MGVEKKRGLIPGFDARVVFQDAYIGAVDPEDVRRLAHTAAHGTRNLLINFPAR